jgi:hypothetical protein
MGEFLPNEKIIPAERPVWLTEPEKLFTVPGEKVN